MRNQAWDLESLSMLSVARFARISAQFAITAKPPLLVSARFSTAGGSSAVDKLVSKSHDGTLFVAFLHSSLTYDSILRLHSFRLGSSKNTERRITTKRYLLGMRKR